MNKQTKMFLFIVTLTVLIIESSCVNATDSNQTITHTIDTVNVNTAFDTQDTVTNMVIFILVIC